ncbi:class I adenylate-forming enzyme family protein [Cupriavidus basilensis]
MQPQVHNKFHRIGDIAYHWASAIPDRPAIYEDGRLISYDELWKCVVRARRFLKERGVTSGDRVMIVAENSLVLVVFLFAIQELSAWPVIINARLSDKEIDEIKLHCHPRLMLFTHAASPDALRHGVTHRALEVSPSGLPTLMVGNVDASSVREASDLAREVALLSYTSGATGRPKGVMVTQRGLLHFARVTQIVRRMSRNDRVYGLMPISHIFGVGTGLLATLYSGACLHLASRFDPYELLAAIASGGISILQGMPTMFNRIRSSLKRTEKEAFQPPRLRYLYTGGAPLDLDLKRDIESMFGLPLHHGYGMTEYAGAMTVTRMEQPRSDVAVGDLVAGAEGRLIAQDGSAAPQGQAGELWVRGPGLMRGYYRDPELTAGAITSDGWLRTGDLARVNSDNSLHVIGRIGDVIVRSGHNVFPSEVEAVLNAHPTVRLAAVIGLTATHNNEEVIAFIEVHQGSNFDPVEICRYVEERLEVHQRPSRYIRTTSIPIAASGKILKRQLHEELENNL